MCCFLTGKPAFFVQRIYVSPFHPTTKWAYRIPNTQNDTALKSTTRRRFHPRVSNRIKSTTNELLAHRQHIEINPAINSSNDIRISSKPMFVSDAQPFSCRCSAADNAAIKPSIGSGQNWLHLRIINTSSSTSLYRRSRINTNCTCSWCVQTRSFNALVAVPCPQ